MTLKTLVAKWRGYGEDTRFGHSVYEDCADELEAALAVRDGAETTNSQPVNSSLVVGAETPRGEVTDAMVERGCEEWIGRKRWRDNTLDEIRKETFRVTMRRTLEAALSLPKPADVGKAGASWPTETPAVEAAETYVVKGDKS